MPMSQSLAMLIAVLLYHFQILETYLFRNSNQFIQFIIQLEETANQGFCTHIHRRESDLGPLP